MPTILMYAITVHQRYRRTDGRTGRNTVLRMFVLRVVKWFTLFHHTVCG